MWIIKFRLFLINPYVVYDRGTIEESHHEHADITFDIFSGIEENMGKSE